MILKSVTNASEQGHGTQYTACEGARRRARGNIREIVCVTIIILAWSLCRGTLIWATQNDIQYYTQGIIVRPAHGLIVARSTLSKYSMYRLTKTGDKLEPMLQPYVLSLASLRHSYFCLKKYCEMKTHLLIHKGALGQ